MGRILEYVILQNKYVHLNNKNLRVQGLQMEVIASPKHNIENGGSYCLGIESTGDDFSVGILSFDGKVHANIISAFMPEEGGIHPREAARHHAEVAGQVIAEAFKKAKISPKDVTIVAFSQ